MVGYGSHLDRTGRSRPGAAEAESHGCIRHMCRHSSEELLMSQMWGNSTGGVRYEPRCFCASSRKDGALLAKMETRHLQSPRDTVAHRPRRVTCIGTELKSMRQSENTGRCGHRERR